MHEKTAFLVEALRGSNGELTEGVRTQFREKFGSGMISGTSVRNARKELGIAVAPWPSTPRQSVKKPAVPSEFTEALNMVGEVDKLNKALSGVEEQIQALEEKKAEIKRQIDQYKPVLAHLRNLSQAVGQVREKAV